MRFSRLAVAAVAAGLAASAVARESIIICQAHPDDLSACLGFALKAKDRFDLHVVSYTGGEGGIGQTHNFHPNQYLETTDVWTDLVRITRLWKSQNANDSLVRTKTQEALFSGSQMITPKRYAEAYETLVGVPAGKPTVFQEIARDSRDAP